MLRTLCEPHGWMKFRSKKERVTLPRMENGMNGRYKLFDVQRARRKLLEFTKGCSERTTIINHTYQSLLIIKVPFHF